MNRVIWNGSNKTQIDEAFRGTPFVPLYFGRMNATRLVVRTKEGDISVGLYDTLTVGYTTMQVEKYRYGRW